MSEIDLSSPLNYGTPSSLGSIRTPRSGIRGTPIRMRPDVRSDKRIRQVNVGNEAAVSISILRFFSKNTNYFYWLSISMYLKNVLYNHIVNWIILSKFIMFHVQTIQKVVLIR